MAGRRRGRRSGAANSFIPLTSRRISNTLSCWYCDVKVDLYNALLYSFGHRHGRFLRGWFAVGVFSSILALCWVTVMLIQVLASNFFQHSTLRQLSNVSMNWLFGIPPLVPSLRISMLDGIIILLSTVISVAAHEFGHAIAAASVGVQIEYIAIFLAILVPGALVAFDNDLLQSLPHFASLQIYCAGIWHNIVVCAICSLTLSLLPLIFYPIYIHNEGPMVLGVPQTSPLTGYLSPGDVILAVDGYKISNPYEWMNMAQAGIPAVHKVYFSDSPGVISSHKGYCVPNSWVDASSKQNSTAINKFPCPENQAAFFSISCFNPGSSLGNGGESIMSRERDTYGKIGEEDKHCLTAKDVVKLTKCGNWGQLVETERNFCPCSEEEICMAPFQGPRNLWVEISYSSPYSPECLQLIRGSSSVDSLPNKDGSNICGGSFVFIGDAHSMAQNIWLSAYRPRWAFTFLISHIPAILEKIFTCTFHVSASLALLNSLPVFFLDGESMLETIICYFSWLNPRQKRQVHLFCLLGGSLLVILAISKLMCFILHFL